MAKHDAIRLGTQDSGAQALVKGNQITAGHRLKQPHLRSLGHDRDRVEQIARGSTEPRDPRQHRLTNRRRHRLATRRQHLRDKERIPCSAGVQIHGIDRRRARECANSSAREPTQLHARTNDASRQLADDDPKRMRTVQAVIAEAQNDERRRRLNPPSQQPHDIERRLIAPMKILQHQHTRRTAAQPSEHRSGDVVRASLARHQRGRLTAQLLSRRQQRTEWARREQRVAHSPQHREAAGKGRAELPQQRRLADARLTEHERDPPLGRFSDLRDATVQLRQLVCPLEQPARDLHDR